MTQTRLRENPVGQQIYEMIKDYDKNSRVVYLKNLGEEQRTLYDKYRKMVNKRNSLKNGDNQERQDRQAKAGMKTLRASRTPQQKIEYNKQRKPYDAKYEAKRRAVTKIQRLFRKNKDKKTVKSKISATEMGKDIWDDIYSSVINQIPEKRSVGRPKKQ